MRRFKKQGLIKTVLSFAVLLVLILSLAGCDFGDFSLSRSYSKSTSLPKETETAEESKTEGPIAVIETESIPTVIEIEPIPTEAKTVIEPPTKSTPIAQSYVVNTNTKKFHYPGCSSVSTIKDKNRWDYTGTREDLIDSGYEPCKRCNP